MGKRATENPKEHRLEKAEVRGSAGKHCSRGVSAFVAPDTRRPAEPIALLGGRKLDAAKKAAEIERKGDPGLGGSTSSERAPPLSRRKGSLESFQRRRQRPK